MKLYSQVCFGLLVVFFCNTEKPTVVSDFCSSGKLIIASRQDTPETLSQIRTHNAKIHAHCDAKK